MTAKTTYTRELGPLQITNEAVSIVTHSSAGLTVTHWFGDVDAILFEARREFNLEFGYAPTVPGGLG